MSGVRYLVEIELATIGDLGMGKIQPALDRTESKVKKIGDDLSGLGGRMLSGFSGIALGTMVGGLLQQGANAAFSKIHDGVIGINKELETTKVSLAAVLNSNGLSDSIEGGMSRAADWMAQLKKDAKELPGEFEDLIGIVQSGAGAAFQAGLDERQFGNLAAQAMAAGKALSIDMPQAGRDLGRLLGGSAGMDNMLGSRLGFTADNFNQLDKAQQVQKITEALGKFEPAIKVFGQTMDAQSSTLTDNVKAFTGAATKDLFARMVSTLSEVNTWFDNNQSTVTMYANKVSGMLTNAWDTGRKFVEEWGPSFVSFAERFYDRFMAAWREAEPVVKTIAGYLKEALDNPETLGRLETVLKLYAGAKVVGAANGMFGGLGSSALSSLAPSAGAMAMHAKGLLSIGGGLASNAFAPAAGAIGAAGAGTTALIGGVVAATLAAIGATGYELYSAHNRASTYDAAGGGAYGYSAGAQTFVDKQVASAIAAGSGAERSRFTQIDEWRRDNKNIDVSKFADGLGVSYEQVRAAHEHEEDSIKSLADATFETSESMNELQSIIRGLAKSGDFEAIAKINQGLMDAQQDAAFQAQGRDLTDDMFRMNAGAIGIQAINALDKAAEKAKQKKAVAGAGNVNIARVEITVSNNNAPGQVARDVAKELVQMKRYRRSSPATLNVSAGR